MNKKGGFFMEIPISEYYYSLDRDGKKALRLEVCKRCGIESYQFYRRMREGCWSPLEEKEIRCIIEEMMREQLF